MNWVCGADGKGKCEEKCTDPNKPYYCEKTGACWANKAQCDQAITCGNVWAACVEPDGNVIKCVNNEAGCCNANFPYFCPSNDFCFSKDGFCDGRTVYDCNKHYWVCNKKSDVGTCFGDVVRCCPSGETWWESDKQCHKSAEPQKCAVPDGSSANCDCDSDLECKAADASKPYCGETYGKRTDKGFHACLASKPKYCGDGSCEGGETYNNCQADCGSQAPKGKINVDVTYSSGSSKGKPISSAYVYLDGVSKGTTDSNGKKSFEASYGSKEVKVLCPDTAFCAEKTVNVDGTESVNLGCNCNLAGDSDGDGYSDDDERLLGTDIKNANSNFEATFASDSVDLLACIPTPASFLILWKEYKKGGSIIQSHSLVVNSLTVTSVMSASFGDGSFAVGQALAAAGIQAEGAEIFVNPA
ncbi:MAG: hypothetical protein AABX60_01770, partial [Nanoarchaeota archaeon]